MQPILVYVQPFTKVDGKNFYLTAWRVCKNIIHIEIDRNFMELYIEILPPRTRVATSAMRAWLARWLSAQTSGHSRSFLLLLYDVHDRMAKAWVSLSKSQNPENA